MAKPRVTSAMLVFVLLIALAVWTGVAVSVDDALWFIPLFRADASYVDLYWDGSHLLLEPGSSGYLALNTALQADLPHVESYSTGTGLSDATLDALRAEGRLLEARYAEPVRVHTWYNFGASKVYYIPLSGYHASQARLFNSARGTPLELRSIDAILAAAQVAAEEAGLNVP